jgi:hypothetical protein
MSFFKTINRGSRTPSRTGSGTVSRSSSRDSNGRDLPDILQKDGELWEDKSYRCRLGCESASGAQKYFNKCKTYANHIGEMHPEYMTYTRTDQYFGIKPDIKQIMPDVNDIVDGLSNNKSEEINVNIDPKELISSFPDLKDLKIQVDTICQEYSSKADFDVAYELNKKFTLMLSEGAKAKYVFEQTLNKINTALKNEREKLYNRIDEGNDEHTTESDNLRKLQALTVKDKVTTTTVPKEKKNKKQQSKKEDEEELSLNA